MNFPELLRIVTRLGGRLQIFNMMFGRLAPDKPLVIETFAASSTCNLMKISNAQDRSVLSIEFAQLSEQNCANRNVDTNSESVSSTYQFEKTVLSQSFDKEPVFWQKASVMNPYARLDESGDVFAKR